MGYLPAKDTKFTGTETLTNLTANSSGTIDLDAATTVTVPTITVGSSTQKAVNEAALQTYLAGQLASYATTTALDAAVAGLDMKASVRVATTAALAITGRTATTLTLGGTTLTIDGVALANADRVLVKDATTGTGAGAWDNGIYTVGGIGTSVVLTRSTDADSWTELPGAIVPVEVGTTNADKAWMVTADQGGTLGTTAITTTSFGAGSVYSGGTYITLTGTSFDLNTSTAMTLGTAQTVTGLKTIATASSGTSSALETKRSADASRRFRITNDGSLGWFDGAGGSGASLSFTSGASVPTFGGTWDFSTAATITVATGSAGDATTAAASTLFVQQNTRRRSYVAVADGSFPYTITASSSIPSADFIVTQQTALSRAITLCAANAVMAGTTITIKDGSASGAATYPITVNRAGSDTIDGLTSFTIDINAQAIDLVSDGSSKWWVA